MTEQRLADQPFGTYALRGSKAWLRRWANALPESPPSRWAMSLARRLCLSGEAPVDVEVFSGLHARLYPRTNRCEKRMFVGETTWDAAERAALGEALMASDRGRPFVFVDGGANVGMYSLFLISMARRLSRPLKVVAVEPDPTNLGRLRDNLAASAAHEAMVVAKALGARRGTARLMSEQANRGEVRVSEEGDVVVPMAPLADVVIEAELDHVDVLKLDIEGHELPVLTAFFKQAPKRLWPRRILLEVQKTGETPAFDLCLARGYEVELRTRINALLRLA
jgi:FkbM family methyltransferase